MSSRVCSVEGCGRPHNARGLCWAHSRQDATGRPLTAIVSRWDEVRCMDAEWLLDSGEIPENVARRMGVGSVDALVRGLQRAGRRELAARIWAAHGTWRGGVA